MARRSGTPDPVSLVKPRALPPRGTIGIVAPASPIDPERLAGGIAALEARGIRTFHRDDVCARSGYLAGDDARRGQEFMEMVEDPRVDAILCARGGYGSQRIVGRLHPGRVRRAAKPLIGFSDVTTLHLWQRQVVGLVSFHGPMLERGGDLLQEEISGLLETLTGEGPDVRIWEGEPGGGGRAEGWLVGGNLAVVAGSLGTPWEVDTREAILLFEDVHEEPYRIDRLLGQLAAAGKLEGLAGVGVGALVACEAAPASLPAGQGPGVPTPSAREAIQGWIEPLGIPVVFGLPFGHAAPNLTWPQGVRGLLDGDRGELHILEQGVRR